MLMRGPAYSEQRIFHYEECKHADFLQSEVKIGKLMFSGMKHITTSLSIELYFF